MNKRPYSNFFVRGSNLPPPPIWALLPMLNGNKLAYAHLLVFPNLYHHMPICRGPSSLFSQDHSTNTSLTLQLVWNHITINSAISPETENHTRHSFHLSTCNKHIPYILLFCTVLFFYFFLYRLAYRFLLFWIVINWNQDCFRQQCKFLSFLLFSSIFGHEAWHKGSQFSIRDGTHAHCSGS